MKKRKDIFENTPEIGDTIVYNPAKYKRLIFGKCVGFSKSSGLPLLEIDESFGYVGQKNTDGTHSPKTGFVIYKNK
jgi:hypothetical protein